MQHFTREWWAADSPNAADVFARYAEHFNAIRAALPADLIALYEDHTLHDSEVKDISCDFENRHVTLALNGWDRDLKQEILYTLRYLGVSGFRQHFPEQDFVEEELGDVAYWECDLKSNAVEMCMLFVSGAEFTIHFKDFELQWRQRSEA